MATELSWDDKLIQGALEEDAQGVALDTLEITINDLKNEGYTPDETTRWDHALSAALRMNQLITVGQLRALNHRLAEHYIELEMQQIKKIVTKAGKVVAGIGDWIFAKSGGEAGRVTEVISTGSPHYNDVRDEYVKRYGLHEAALYENATCLYRVVHADGVEELYYNTETAFEPSQLNIATQAAEPTPVNAETLKKAVSLWWSLLPNDDKQKVFAQAGARLDILDNIAKKLARSTEDEIAEYHPLLATAYRHVAMGKEASFESPKSYENYCSCKHLAGEHTPYGKGKCGNCECTGFKSVKSASGAVPPLEQWQVQDAPGAQGKVFSYEAPGGAYYTIMQVGSGFEARRTPELDSSMPEEPLGVFPTPEEAWAAFGGATASLKTSAKKCPGCGKEIWDASTVDQRLNKCWGCGLRFDNPEESGDDAVEGSAKTAKKDITRTITLYEFGELDEKAKDKVRSYWYEHFVNLELWKEMNEDDLAQKGFVGAKISYSLGNSQGDGASFECKEIDIPKVIASLGMDEKFNALTANGVEVSASIDRVDSRYSHANTVRALVEIHSYGDDLAETHDRIDQLANEFQEALSEQAYTIGSALTKEGYEEIDYQVSDEAINDTATENGYMFHANGQIEFDTEG